MKKITLIAICFLASAIAQARTPMAQNSVTLHNVEIDGVISESAVAIARLNLATQKLNVEIYNDHCGSFSPVIDDQTVVHCMAMPSLINSFEVKYKVSDDGCGSKIYSGSKDLRPVDGNLVEIKLVDNSKRLCENVVAGLSVLEINSVAARGGKKSFYAYGNEKLNINNDEAIYNALNVKEVVLNPGITGASRTQKSVGGLVCEKTLIMVPNAVPTYSCSLNR